MIINDILNKEYRLCDFEERQKSVIYREVDLDRLICGDSKMDEANLIVIVYSDIASKII